MRVKTLAISTLIIGATAFASDEFEKLKPETDRDFVERASNGKIYENQFSRTRELKTDKDILLGVIKRPDETGNYDLDLTVLIPTKNNGFKALSTIACEIEGGSPTISAYFYVQLSRGSEKVIGVICRWPEHKHADCPSVREIHFFKIAQDSSALIQIQDEKINSLLYHEYKPIEKEDLVCKKALFASAADIKSILLHERSKTVDSDKK